MADQPLQEFLESLAAKTPTPGGGAVASVTAALAAALAQMVVNYSIGKKALAAHDAAHQQALNQLQELRLRALRLAEADAAAYARLNTLWKLDKADPRRIAEFPAAVEAAIEAPHQVLHASMEILRLLRSMTGTTNAMLNSDLAIAAVLADAAAHAAAWNVRINLPLLDDADMREAFVQQLSATLEQAASHRAHVESACR